MDRPEKFRIAARGLIVQEEKLLFVSDNGDYWYLPGGRLEGNESLSVCVEREVYEETGLVVKTGNILHVLEAYDLNENLHKINFYFQTTILTGQVSDHWHDEGGCVRYRRYFTLPEIQQQSNILPRFLGEGEWLKPTKNPNHVYQGFIYMKGFEMAEPVVE